MEIFFGPFLVDEAAENANLISTVDNTVIRVIWKIERTDRNDRQ